MYYSFVYIVFGVLESFEKSKVWIDVEIRK